ncbi:MAG: DegT/DnrJ/EryC1/StrS family aminotransferase [Lachnospiraceae bacterium]|nr:DegT/DnrJ/EryC1/StrS family aminotransferase [Lachnospiraceae bacterium]
MNYLLSNDTWENEEKEAMKKVIDSGKVTMGENVKELERIFALKFGTKYAIMSNSGSSANLLAIAALVYSGRLQIGDEVLVTAVSWSTTYFPIAQMGLKLRFVDIDRNTLNVDYDELEKAVTPKSKAVLAVNLLGNPNDFTRLDQICKKNNLILIEDNCESMGAEFNGKKAGSFGVLGTFSMYYSHHICSMEGGMTVTDDEELYHYMLSIRSHGWTRHLPQNSKIYEKKEDKFYESFNFIMPGYNLRPLEIEAVAGIEQLKKLDRFVEQRIKNAEYFSKRVKEQKDMQIQKTLGKSSWFGFAITLCNELEGKRKYYTDELIKNNIEVRPIVAGNFTKQKALEYMDYSISGQLVNADYIHDNGFFVGNHSIDMREKIDYLFEVLNQVGKH